MVRGLTLLLVLFVLLGGAPVFADESASDRFAALTRGYRSVGREALPAFRAALLAEHPDFWEVPLATGRLRSDLAAELDRERILALFARASRRPDRQGERWAALAGNLSMRRDLPEILLAVNALPLLLPAQARLLTQVAMGALLDGDPTFALALLADPRSVESSAEDLLDFSHPEGIGLVADVVTGRFHLSPECRALLGGLHPDIHNRFPTRPLGPDRVEALAKAAAEDPDPAMRLLAARLLLYSGDSSAFAATVRAYGALEDPRVQKHEREEIGEWWWKLPGEDLDLVLKVGIVDGYLGGGRMLADNDRQSGEEAARELRRLLQTAEDPRFRAEVIRRMHWHDGAFVAFQKLRRPHGAPAWKGLLDDLGRGRDDDPETLRRLSARVAGELSGHLTGGVAERRRGDPEPPASPVAARLAEFLESPDPRSDLASEIGRWLELDPLHLLDPTVGKLLAGSPGFRREFLESYPREAVRRLLLDPPGPHRDEAWAKYAADDLLGAVNRDRLLALLAFGPAHLGTARDPEVVGAWPARNRRMAGRALQYAGASPEEVSALLEDDEFAAGYLSGAVLDPRGAGYDLVASLVAGAIHRPALLGKLADWGENKMPERLARSDDDPWPEQAPVLDPSLRIQLAARMKVEPDPWVVWLAARILALSATPADLAALLEAGQDLDVASVRDRHPFWALSRAVDSPAKLEVLLAFVGNAGAAPRARLAVLDGLSWLDWLDRMPPDEIHTAEKRMMEWIATEAPRLTGAMAESVLELWHTQALQSDRPEALGAFLRAVAALSGTPAGVRLLRLAGGR